MLRFEPGQVILHRHFARDRLVFAPLVRVVADDEYGLRIWLPHGTPLIRELTTDGEGPRDMPFAEWITRPKHIVEDRFRGPGTLKLIPPGARHAIWWLFQGDGTFVAWYGNLEEPSVRWSDGDTAGIDTTDHDLDLWIWPDRSWEWKDEDELTERLAFPDHYWVDDADAVWAEGYRLVELIEAGAFPFDGTWTDFRPDPAWTLPDRLPAGWGRERAR